VRFLLFFFSAKGQAYASMAGKRQCARIAKDLLSVRTTANAGLFPPPYSTETFFLLVLVLGSTKDLLCPHNRAVKTKGFIKTRVKDSIKPSALVFRVGGGWYVRLKQKVL
jgi:hypothetical protein